MYLVKIKTSQSKSGIKGYYADEDIPFGTIIFCYGSEDKKISKEEFANLPKEKQEYIIENDAEDEFGNWDINSNGAYVSHSCDPNIMPLYVKGNYFNIAIKNIKKGQEITADFGIFYCAAKWKMKCNCGSKNCRKYIGFGLKTDYELEKQRENLTKKVVLEMSKVPQPIFKVKDKEVQKIAKLLKEINNPHLARYTKFSIIDK